jgi:peptidoglycan/LPS O-acetylase OafA/YrhL
VQESRKLLLCRWDTRLKSHYDNSFDAIRFVLAAFVVFAHSYLLTSDNLLDEPLYIFSKGQLNFGTVAVDFFFVVSGFLVTKSWIFTRSAKRYFEKRISRIIPGFILASSVSVIVGAFSSRNAIGFLSGIDVRSTLVRVLSLHQSGLRGAFPDNPSSLIDLTLWTIKYECDCYIIIAVLGLTGLLARAPVAVVFALSASSYLAQSGGHLEMPQWDYGVMAIFFSNPQNWPRLFTYFFAGASFYFWRALIPKSPILFGAALITVIVGLRYGAADLALVTGGSYCIFFVALSTASALRIQGARVDLSYGIYLFGFPIQQLIVMWSSQSVTPIWLFMMAFPATCCVAYVSWKFIESPSLRWDWPIWSILRSRQRLEKRPAGVKGPLRDVGHAP